MVIWSNEAKADLRKIHKYISTDSKLYADNVKNNIIDKADTLDEMKKKFRVESEFNDETIRYMIVYSYKLLYRIVNNEVILVLGLPSQRQSLRKKFSNIYKIKIPSNRIK